MNHQLNFNIDKAIISCKMSKINIFKMDELLGYNHRVATLFTIYSTVSGIIIPSLKSIEQL